uniref:Uncharacterized protein n=1 Tax=Rhizophora mucronata TaxID=61149 RepID=A0A2P2P436_RHIMU
MWDFQASLARIIVMEEFIHLAFRVIIVYCFGTITENGYAQVSLPICFAECLSIARGKVGVLRVQIIGNVHIKQLPWIFSFANTFVMLFAFNWGNFVDFLLVALVIRISYQLAPFLRFHDIGSIL